MKPINPLYDFAIPDIIWDRKIDSDVLAWSQRQKNEADDNLDDFFNVVNTPPPL